MCYNLINHLLLRYRIISLQKPSSYPDAKQDLATVFLERCLEFCQTHGVTSIVLPQNWLFLTNYKKLREKLLKADTWHLIARLGPQAFQTPMWDFNVQLITLSRSNAPSTHLLQGLDVATLRTTGEKAAQLISNEIVQVAQGKQLENPDARIALDETQNIELLAKYASGNQGIKTSDDPLFIQMFWEQQYWNETWEFFQSTVPATALYGGCERIVLYENGKGMMRALSRGQDRDRRRDMQGNAVWGKPGIAVSCMSKLPVALYNGQKFDTNVAMIVPHNHTHIPAIWCFCSSPEYSEAVRQIDQSLKVTNATLVKVPFDLGYWSQIAARSYPHGLPKPYSDDPTQWLFHGHPCGSVVWNKNAEQLAYGPLHTNETVLQVTVARLLSYRWPAELDPAMELADEARTWVNRCADLLPLSDKDGIVCLPPVRGESAADERLLKLLAAAYGDAWRADTLATLLTAVGWSGKSLASWLRDAFFTQHCKLFQHRPFIWHIWDGQPDGFAALVNYHKFDAKLLETLIYTYLGDWINRQKQGVEDKVEGARTRLTAAETLKKRLELILEGEAPYDIFVRWKPLHEQPIGWNPDLNDGVRLNIRPFLSVPDVGKKGAGVLRDRPNIKWEKDRGKDVEAAPWYHQFHGERINDHHLSLAEKQAARKVAQ